MSDEKHMTVQEAGRIGGNKRKATGADYAALGKKGGATTKERHGLEHYANIGKKGGEKTRETLGEEHYSEIGKRGGASVRRLMAAGRAAEERDHGQSE